MGNDGWERPGEDMLNQDCEFSQIIKDDGGENFSRYAQICAHYLEQFVIDVHWIL